MKVWYVEASEGELTGLKYYRPYYIKNDGTKKYFLASYLKYEDAVKTVAELNGGKHNDKHRPADAGSMD